MSTISFCSPKGGCAKSTSCILTGLEFARAGSSVVILDSDPKAWLSSWANIKDIPHGIKVRHIEQENLTDAALEAAEDADYVLIDVEGSDDASIIDAILVSDLVIIPSQASRPDALGAVATLKKVRSRSKILGRNILARVLLTMTEAGSIEYRITGELKRVLEDAKAPMLSAQLAYRPIFKALVSMGGDYQDLPERFKGSSPESAQKNVEAIVKEIKTVLKEDA